MQPRVLVGTAKGLYEVGRDRPVQFVSHEVRALAPDSSILWAIVESREVWQADGSGAETQVASSETLKANCLLPTSAGLLVGTSEAHLLALQGDTLELLRSFDTAPGREAWHTPWGGPPDVRSLAFDPSGTLYVNVHVGGVVRSSDNGRSWTPTIDVHADVHEVCFDPNSGLVVAASARGLAVSDDQGESWRFDTKGLHGTYLRAVTMAGETVLTTASTGPFTNRAAVYRKPVNSGEPFEQCLRGLPEWFFDNINTACLTASDAWVAFGTPAGEVFLSSDAGQSWKMMATGFPPIRCVSMI